MRIISGTRTACIVAAAWCALAATPAAAQDDPRVTAEIIALAQAQIDATVARAPVAQRMSAISDDYTLFQSYSLTRLDGKAAVVALNTALDAGGGKTLVTQMVNSRVQQYGDTAILTYNTYGINQNREGATSSDQSRITRVYVRRGGRWTNVHTHISSPAKPG